MSLLTEEVRRLVMRSHYDADLALDLYVSNRDAHLTYSSLLPLVGIVARENVFGKRGESLEETINEVLGPLYFKLSQRKYNGPKDDPASFTSYFYKFIRTELLRPAMGKGVALLSDITSPRRGGWVENRVNKHQIPDRLRRTIRSRFRFKGPEYEFCCCLLEQIIQDDRIDTSCFKSQWHINDSEFFITYVTYHLRLALSEIRGEGLKYFVNRQFQYQTDDIGVLI